MDSLRDLEVSRAHPARCIRLKHRAERLVLRPVLMTDAEEVAAAVNASLPELKRFMPWSHKPQNAKSHIERIRQGEHEYFNGRDMVMALFREGDKTMLTMVGLHPRVALNPSALEVGYWAPTAQAGRGWTTLAVRVAIVYAFDKLGADRVQVTCDEANRASRRVIEKCGFELEGVFRNLLSASPELASTGYEATRRNCGFALFPDTFAELPWVAELRQSTSYVNLAGYELS
jgi:ribosomal-protein-serine acetyltransferase